MTLNSVRVTRRSARRRAWTVELAPIEISPIVRSFQTRGARASASNPEARIARSKSSYGVRSAQDSSHMPKSACSFSSPALRGGTRSPGARGRVCGPAWASSTTPAGLNAKTTTVSMPSIREASAQMLSAVSSTVVAASRRAIETVVAARSCISSVNRSEADRARPWSDR
jgi:hypothetical protein